MNEMDKEYCSDFYATSWGFQVDPVNPYAYGINYFTKDECEKIVDIASFQKLQQAKINSKTNIQAEILKIRDSEVSWLYPNKDTEWVFRRLTDIVVDLNSQFFKFDIFGAMEGFQFTKYTAPTGHYGKHIDAVFNGQVRKLSFTLQLSESDDYEGGDLNLYIRDEPETMKRSQGSVSIFPSYVLHQVTPVTKGTRYALVSWITGKPFK